MERESARNPHHSTSNLLSWSVNESSSSSSSASAADDSHRRHYQPSDRIGMVLSVGQFTEEESQDFNRSKTFRKPCSGYKLREMCGSKIFAVCGEDDSKQSGSTVGGNNSNNRMSVRIVQQAANGRSQISFGAREEIFPKKSTNVPEVAKQRELSGTSETESDSRTGKHNSNAKSKELSGNSIFGYPEITPLPSADAQNVEINENTDKKEPAPPSLPTSVKSHPAGGQSNLLFGDERKTSKKIHNQKFAELTENDIFRGDQSAEKPSSVAKMKEMSGCDIFAAAGKVDESRHQFGGGRQPPGGQSTIALV